MDQKMFKYSAQVAADFVRQRITCQPEIAMILGSGLSSLADSVQDPRIIPFGDIPDFPTSTVQGHMGRLVVGYLANIPVLIMQGRVHYYEGYDALQITFPIRVMQFLGIKKLIVTNAAGGLDNNMKPGDLMAIDDHIYFAGMAGHSPLRGPADEDLGPRFPSMTHAYSHEMLEALDEVAAKGNVHLLHGVYAMVAGPSFETPAEVRMLRGFGANAVGMSTAPEVVAARHAGIDVLGISMISNVAIDSLDSQEEPNHEEVLEAGLKATPVLANLIRDVLPHLL